MTQSFHTRSCFQRIGFVDFSTVPMTQSFHTRSCFHCLCSMHVFCKIRQLWVNSGDGLWILVPLTWTKIFILQWWWFEDFQWWWFVDFSTYSMTQSFHTRSCFHRLCSMHVCCKKRQVWVDRGDGLWILVPFTWTKIFILSLVFTAFDPCTYAVKYVNFGSTGAMGCGF